MSYKGKIISTVAAMIISVITTFIISYSYFGVYKTEEDWSGAPYETLNLTPLVVAGGISCALVAVGFCLLIHFDGKEIERQREEAIAREARNATSKTLNNTAMRAGK